MVESVLSLQDDLEPPLTHKGIHNEIGLYSHRQAGGRLVDWMG